MTEKCTGPFSNAFDCPVHDPRKQPAMTEPREPVDLMVTRGGRITLDHNCPPKIGCAACEIERLRDLVRQQRAALIEALGLLESVIRQQVNLPDAAFTARHVLMAAVALTTDEREKSNGTRD